MDITGFSAFIALCMTSEISDHRKIRRQRSPASSMSTGRPLGRWNRTSPPVITPGARSSRVIANARVDLPQPLSPARPSTSPRCRTRSASATACTAPGPVP